MPNPVGKTKHNGPHRYTEEQYEVSFWERVDKSDPNGCWLWTGSVVQGYGRTNRSAKFWVRGVSTGLAHRQAWMYLVGEIPEGTELDHLCRVRHCVNPDHLEAVPHAENVKRAAEANRKTHCPRGHEYNEVNAYKKRWKNKDGSAGETWCCRVCKRDKKAEAKLRTLLESEHG